MMYGLKDEKFVAGRRESKIMKNLSPLLYAETCSSNQPNRTPIPLRDRTGVKFSSLGFQLSVLERTKQVNELSTFEFW